MCLCRTRVQAAGPAGPLGLRDGDQGPTARSGCTEHVPAPPPAAGPGHRHLPSLHGHSLLGCHRPAPVHIRLVPAVQEPCREEAAAPVDGSLLVFRVHPARSSQQAVRAGGKRTSGRGGQRAPCTSQPGCRLAGWGALRGRREPRVPRARLVGPPLPRQPHLLLHWVRFCMHRVK